MLRSANAHGTPWYLLAKHVVFVCVGVSFGFAISLIPMSSLHRLSWITLIVVIILLALVLILGHANRGATRWIGFWHFKFQPSELAKFALPLFMAATISSLRNTPYRSLKVLVSTLPIVAVVVGLVAIEPDYGTAAHLALTCAAIYFVAEMRTKYIIGLAILAGPCLVMAYNRSDHFRERILGFFKLWSDRTDAPWQIKQAFVAIGSGGLFGMGLGNGMNKHLVLADSFNDFAFASMAEEGGFVLASLVIVLFLTLVVRGAILSLSLKSHFARLLGFGLTISLGGQAFMNICVVLGLIPTTGINLPFVSYGGSGMIANLVTAGLLLSVLRSRYEGGTA